MNMTLEQYILNPMGKNNAVLNASARESIRESYIKKFGNLMLRENGRIEYHLYKDSKSNTYWIYLKIPSETVRNFYYDVVLKFSADQKVENAGEDLFKYSVKFYSNDPAFVYTYAHVFLKNDLFIKELSTKMSKEAIRKNPKEKNPGNNIGYVKTIYFAYLFIKNRNLNKKVKFEAESKKFDLKLLLSSIEDADDKIRDRQEKGNKQPKERKNIKIPQNDQEDNGGSNLKVRTTKTIGSIGKRISNVKSVKKVGTIKRK